MRIAIINGPNLNLLGKRNPQLYGTTSMEQVLVDIQRQWLGTHFVYFQSNHEGALIDKLQEIAASHEYAGVVLNAGGYTHTSVALRDAIEYVVQEGTPVVEVHLSNIYAREDFRKINLIKDVCVHTITGHGPNGYKEAVEFIIRSAD